MVPRRAESASYAARVKARVPLVVITGFLGAGKTTLVNRVLARRAAAGARDRIGVIVNELGEVGIDGALLAGGAPKQIELPGGCVCCVLGDELDQTLVGLVDGTPELAAIVLETTGVAEPLPIAWAVAKVGSAVSERVRLAAVVTLVDAEGFRAARPVSVAVDAQVAYADVVLLTKAELAGDDEVRAVEAVVRELAPRAEIRSASTDAHAAWLEQLIADPTLERQGDEAPTDAHAHGDDHAHDHGEHAAHGIDSVWVEVPEEVDLEELEDELAALPRQYVRIKGIARGVDARGGEPVRGWFAFHRVGLRVSSEPVDAPGWASGRAVALGPGVQEAALAACIAASALLPGSESR